MEVAWGFSRAPRIVREVGLIPLGAGAAAGAYGSYKGYEAMTSNGEEAKPKGVARRVNKNEVRRITRNIEKQRGQ